MPNLTNEFYTLTNNVKTGEEIRTLKGNDYPVRSVNFSPTAILW